LLIVIKRNTVDKYAASFSKQQHTSQLNIIGGANVRLNIH